MLSNLSWDWGLTPETNNPDKLNIPYEPSDATNVVYTDTVSIPDGTSVSVVGGDFVYDTRFLHEIPQAELDATDGTSYLYIDLTAVIGST